ncbi:MAG: 23S rRNA (uracil(1939)-C(5))-methyltransferase RlmD [Sphingobacteriales bacterium]|nr:23S rRNA (uracil(1939)-C(5))-methyltransferase RlmD [Sphingobacteriales bacterium]
MRKKKKAVYPILENIEISAIAAEGKGLARVDNFVVFVEKAIPGDVVDAKIIRKKKDYALTEIYALKKPSDKRTEPFCSHFGTCGGCKWQHVLYASQLEFKEQLVKEAFRRIGKMELESSNPILGCEETTYYRNKLEFTFSDRVWLTREQIDSGELFDRNALGFHAAGSFSAVLHITECYLQDEKVNSIRNAVYLFATEHAYSFYNLKFHEGLLRNLIFRNTTTGEWMVTVCFAEPNDEKITALMDLLKTNYPFITSLNYIVNTKKNDTIYDQEVINYSGRDYILEQLGNISYKISPKSFFQTNSKQAKHLYDIVKKMGGFSKDDLVYDLYCGTGSIALYIADICRKVVGIEQIPAAIVDATFNAVLNNIDNSVFHAGTCEDILKEDFIDEFGMPDIVVVDPPRAGLHERVVQVLLQAAPKKIVYVSCNPATQARDVLLFSEKYNVTQCQPVDMFPHTFHIENVVLLELR